MLSILIPVYNYSIVPLVKDIHKKATTSSIDFEIRVVDDHSPDTDLTTDNQKICSLKNTSLMTLEENKGRTFVRDLLARQAKFDHLLFLDADVMPANIDFLDLYLKELDRADIIFGGVTYPENKPPASQLLRWKYGRARETGTAADRKKKPFRSIISMAFLIRKEAFLDANTFKENRYGLDTLFAANLQSSNATVLHIDNPVIHYGLEDSETYLRKTRSGLKTLAHLHKTNKIPADYRPIQNLALGLKKYRLDKFYRKFFAGWESFTHRNLVSPDPSLTVFDAYRLYYFLIYLDENA